MSALDALISSSEGLSSAPADAVAMTPAVKAPSGKSPAGGSNLAIAGKRVSLFRAPDVTSFVDMCFGFVGQGIKFCLNTECETTSHTQDKFVVQPGALYIRHGGNKAFCSPCLLAGRVTDEQEEVMIANTKTAEEWRTIFALVDAQGSGHPMDPAGVVKRLEFYDQAMATRTPYKKRGDDASSSFFEGFSPLEQPSPTSANQSEFMWEETGELPASFVQRFKKLEGAIVALSTTVPTAIGAIGGRLGHQEDLALNTNTRLIATEGEVGEWVHSAGGRDQPAPTLWGALQGAYLESKRLRSLIGQLVQGN